MAAVPITGADGNVNFGAAVPVDIPDYTRDVLAGMRQKQAQEDAAIREAKRQKIARQEKLNKYKNDLGRWQLTQDKGIWQGRTPEIKAMAEDMFQTMMKNKRANPNSYDPESDRELFEKQQEFQRATDEYQQEKKTMEQHMALALDPKKRDTYNINQDALDAWGRGDVEGLQKALAKNIYGDETRSKDIHAYAGVGFLNPIDTTDWHSQTVKAAKSLNIPIREIDLGGGKYKKVQQLSPDEKEQAYQAWSVGAGAKLKKSLIAQAQANNPFFPEEKADEILKPLFLSNIEDNINLKGGQPRMTEVEKQAEKIGSSEYHTKGAEGGAKGINLFRIGSNAGLKADLQYKNEVLKDVDLKTIFPGKDGKLKAIVMQYDYEERPMTEDEKKKEMQSAKVQMREPVFTKTSKIEKPKEIDFSEGSNNYNIIVKQYPGVEDEIKKNIKFDSGKKTTSKEKSYTVKGKSYPESAIKKAADASGMTLAEYIKEANK